MGMWGHIMQIGVWERFRWTWEAVADTMQFSFAFWDGTQFVNHPSVFVDYTPPWIGSAVNRVGIGLWDNKGNVSTWFDETYIYGPG